MIYMGPCQSRTAELGSYISHCFCVSVQSQVSTGPAELTADFLVKVEGEVMCTITTLSNISNSSWRGCQAPAQVQALCVLFVLSKFDHPVRSLSND